MERSTCQQYGDHDCKHGDCAPADTGAERAAARYLEFAAVVADRGEHCKYGHGDCSTRAGGRCSNEYYSELSAAARAIVDGE